MIIDQPHRADIPTLRQLWKQAFGDTDSFLDGFFRTGFSPERCRCVTLDGQLAAALYWFDCHWEGKKIAYLYAIATDEKHRGKGLCRVLMENTHRHLRSLSYSGCVLVPGNIGLFSLYKKMGYTAFCPMEKQTVPAVSTSVNTQPVTAHTYMALRSKLLPVNSISQDAVAFSFAHTFCEFYAGENILLCCSRENEMVYFQEYLGERALLGGIVNSLSCQEGIVYLPGGDQPYAMYHLFEDGTDAPAYFGIPLN